MRIQFLILTTLMACEDITSTNDIDRDTGCEGFVDEDTFDGPLFEDDLDQLSEHFNVSDVTELACGAICVFELSMGHWEENVTDCTFTLHEPADTAEERTADLTCTATMSYPCGRRPLGHVEATCGTSLGAFLAHCAHMETASIHAFEQLAQQLDALGAPGALIRRCRRAAREEARHAELVGALARAHGGVIPTTRAHPVVAEVEAIAHHNATEGCVAETWSALVCAWQARHAHDPELRAVLTEIAEDEAEHAQLAWDLHKWFLTQLPEDARNRVQAAQTKALCALPAQARHHATRVPEVLGMPCAERLSEMATTFSRSLAA
ncbi:MAG: ferritin-like domain-containing protein [Myxococcota bacterium]